MLFLEQILKLPSIIVTDYTIELLPSIRAMYFVGKYEKILYIGTADNLKTKWKTHPKLEWSLYLECNLYWIEIDSALDLGKISTDHLLFHVPPWNSLNKNSLSIRNGDGVKPVVKVESKPIIVSKEVEEDNEPDTPPKKTSSVRDRLRTLGR